MPNPCNEKGPIKVICFADNIQIYESEVLRGSNAQNKHFQIDFLKDTKRLTIEITDANDGITCDHFVLVEAIIKIVDVENNVNQDENEENSKIPEEIITEDHEIHDNFDQRPVDPKRKLTTQWGLLKRN